MFDLGWSELLLIGVVALIVVGPKDLPIMFRKLGQFMGKARGMARDFSRAMESAADDAGMKEINKTLKAAANPKAFGLDKLREATGLDTSPKVASGAAHKPGGATEALAAERAETRRKIDEATAARREAEAAGLSAAQTGIPANALPPGPKTAAEPMPLSSAVAPPASPVAPAAKKATKSKKPATVPAAMPAGTPAAVSSDTTTPPKAKRKPRAPKTTDAA